MKPKLSPAQIKALLALGEPGAVSFFAAGKPQHWYLPPEPFAKLCNHVTMARLESRQTVKIANEFYGIVATITPAGREYLASLDKEAP